MRSPEATLPVPDPQLPEAEKPTQPEQAPRPRHRAIIEKKTGESAHDEVLDWQAKAVDELWNEDKLPENVNLRTLLEKVTDRLNGEGESTPKIAIADKHNTPQAQEDVHALMQQLFDGKSIGELMQEAEQKAGEGSVQEVRRLQSFFQHILQEVSPGSKKSYKASLLPAEHTLLRLAEVGSLNCTALELQQRLNQGQPITATAAAGLEKMYHQFAESDEIPKRFKRRFKEVAENLQRLREKNEKKEQVLTEEAQKGPAETVAKAAEKTVVEQQKPAEKPSAPVAETSPVAEQENTPEPPRKTFFETYQHLSSAEVSKKLIEVRRRSEIPQSSLRQQALEAFQQFQEGHDLLGRTVDERVIQQLAPAITAERRALVQKYLPRLRDELSYGQDLRKGGFLNRATNWLERWATRISITPARFLTGRGRKEVTQARQEIITALRRASADSHSHQEHPATSMLWEMAVQLEEITMDEMVRDKKWQERWQRLRNLLRPQPAQ